MLRSAAVRVVERSRRRLVVHAERAGVRPHGSAAAAAMPAGSRVGGRGLSLVHPDNLLANLLGLPRRFREQASQEEVQDLHRLVEANRRRDTVLPELAAPARAAAAGPEARDVFPGTRTEIYHPEQEIADLSRQLGESGNWLQVTQQALEGEREARLTAEAEAQAVRLAEDAKALEARIAAETEARDARRWRDQAQAHAAARLQADTKLAELLTMRPGIRRSWRRSASRCWRTWRPSEPDWPARPGPRGGAARKAELDRQAASIERYTGPVPGAMVRRAWRIGRRVVVDRCPDRGASSAAGLTAGSCGLGTRPRAGRGRTVGGTAHRRAGAARDHANQVLRAGGRRGRGLGCSRRPSAG